MTDDDFYSDQEYQDSRRVTAATLALQEGRLAFAERELLDVVANAPARYEYMRDVLDSTSDSLRGRSGGGYDCEHDRGHRRCIKAWDADEVTHYVRWHEANEKPHSILWLQAAYPPAYYYLAVICLERRNALQAIDYLKRGFALEMHVKFVLELAAAQISTGALTEALEIYAGVTQVSLGIQPKHVAIAARGAAAILVELGDLDTAESILSDLLEHDPQDELARAELQYIADLRAGRPAREPLFRLTTPGGNDARYPSGTH